MAKDETINDILKSINLSNGQEEEYLSQIRNLLDAEIKIHKAEYGENTESTISNNLRIDLLVSQFLINEKIKGVSEISEISHEQLMKEQTSLMKDKTQRDKLLPIMNGTNKIDVSSEVFNSVLQFHYRGISQENIEDQELAERVENIRQSLQPTSEDNHDQPSTQQQTLDGNTPLEDCNRATLGLEEKFEPSEDYNTLIENLHSRLPQGEAGEKLLHMIELTARNNQYINYMNTLKTDISGDKYSEDRIDRLQALVVELNEVAKKENGLNPDNITTDPKDLPLSTHTVLEVVEKYNGLLSLNNELILRNSGIKTMTDRLTEMNSLLEDARNNQPAENEDHVVDGDAQPNILQNGTNGNDQNVLNSEIKDALNDDEQVAIDKRISQMENSFESEGYKQARKGLEIYLRGLTDSQNLVAMVEDVIKNEAYVNMLRDPYSSNYKERRTDLLKGFLSDLNRWEQPEQSISAEKVLDLIDIHNNELEAKNEDFSNEFLSQRIEATRGQIDSYKQANMTSLDNEASVAFEESSDSDTPVGEDSEEDSLEGTNNRQDNNLTQGLRWDAEIKQMEEQFAQDETARQSYEEVREKLLSLLPKDKNGEIDPELVDAIEDLVRSQAYEKMLVAQQNSKQISLDVYSEARRSQLSDFNQVIAEQPKAIINHYIITKYIEDNNVLKKQAEKQQQYGVTTLSDRIEKNEYAIDGYFMRTYSDEMEKLDQKIKDVDYADALNDESLQKSMNSLSQLEFHNENNEIDNEKQQLAYQLAQNETYRDCMKQLSVDCYKDRLKNNLDTLTTELITNQVLFEELGDDVTKLSKEELQQKLQTIKQQASKKDISQKIQKRLDAFHHGEKIVISPQTSAVTFAVHNHELKKYAENLQKNTGIKSLIKRVRDFDAKMTEKYPKLYPIVKNGLETGGAALLLGPPGLALVSARKTYKSCMKIKQDAQKAGKGFFEYLGDNKAIAAGLGMQVLGSVVSAYTGIDAAVVGNLGIIHQGAEAFKATLGIKIARTSLSSLGAALAQSGINDDWENKRYLQATKKIVKTAAFAAVGLFVGEHAGEAVGWLKEHWPFGHTVPEAENLTPPDLGVDALGNKIPFTDADGNVIYQGMPKGWRPPFAADQTLASADASDPSASEPEPEAKAPSEVKETAKVQQSQSSSEAAKETPASSEGETPADNNTEKDAATDTTTDQPVVADEDLQSKSLLANMPKGYSTGESVDVQDENNIVIGQSYPILDENGDKVADVEASLWKDDIKIISEHHTDGTTIQTTMDGNNVALLAEFDKDNNLTDLDGNLRQTTEGGLKYAFAYSDEPVYCGNTVSPESLNAVMPNSIDTPQGQVLIDSYGYPISAEHAQERLSDIVAKHEIYNDLLSRQTNGDGLSAEETSFMTNHQQDLEREGLEDKDGQLVRTDKMPNSEMRNNMYNQFLDRQKQGLELTPQQQQFIEYHEKLLQQNSDSSATPPETVADKVSALRGTNNPTSHPDYNQLADHQADPQKDFGLPKSNDPLSRIHELRSQPAGSGHHRLSSEGKTTGNSR